MATILLDAVRVYLRFHVEIELLHGKMQQPFVT